MASKEDCDEDLIFADRNRSTLELYINGVNTHDVTIGPDNNYNNFNSNDLAYEDVYNNKEYSAIYEDGPGANTNYEYGIRYLATPANDNPPANYEPYTMDNKTVDKIPEMGATEETAILDAI